MIRLTSQANIAQVLAELKEYATEVDVDFVRKSVRAIGRCAIKEAIVVIKDIFRKYPNKYESIIATLCENLDTLDEPEARASMIWIIGEYAERIDNADELLESFLEGFQRMEHPGPAAAADGHCEAVLEEAHRHPGAGTAGPQPLYTGTYT
ncbi:hypothetical protein DPMN_007486 [Dreissena polymorpha]|uniref:Clathrin/coatomer adaptor adaptin-like N-terminal domain-containing protein n=1 Tax=Dreissena polymorpha TaxID=45954 RepID=A0A9D4MYK1_DREPO|nr:hypothetical protein DPMN_007486 [Dreissena polymorpha]